MYHCAFLCVIASMAFCVGSDAHKLRQSEPIVVDNPCAGVSNGSYVINMKGCEYFFLCIDQQSVEGKCPTNMSYTGLPDPLCDFNHNIVCTIGDEDPEVIDEDGIECPQPDSKSITFVPSKIDCTRYYICYHGRPVQQNCIEDLHWNAKEKKCDYIENAECKIKPPMPECPKNGTHYFSHPYECEYFIFCINGYSTIQQCPFYNFWDSASETCMWRDKVKCDLEIRSSKNRIKTL